MGTAEYEPLRGSDLKRRPLRAFNNLLGDGQTHLAGRDVPSKASLATSRNVAFDGAGVLL